MATGGHRFSLLGTTSVRMPLMTCEHAHGKKRQTKEVAGNTERAALVSLWAVCKYHCAPFRY